MPFLANMHPPWPHPFIVHFNMHQMCLSSQSSMLNGVLNKTALLLAFNLYYQPISSILEINHLLIIIEGFNFLISFLLLQCNLLSLTPTSDLIAFINSMLKLYRIT